MPVQTTKMFDQVEPPTLNGRPLRTGDHVQHYRYAFPGDGTYASGSYVSVARLDPTGETVMVEFDHRPGWGPVPVDLRNLERPL